MIRESTDQEKYIHAIELPKILDKIAQRCGCDDSRAMALALRPAKEQETVQQRLQETDDAYVLMAKFGSPSFYGLTNVVNSVRRAEAGGMLNLRELLQLQGVLAALSAIAKWHSRSEGLHTTLDTRFAQLYPNGYLESRIRSTVASEEEVADTASPELQAIRRKIQRAEMRVREHLDALVHSTEKQKYLQEPIVTMRSGRFVVPVKAECRSEIPGLVHDTSSSGATVFVEPMSVVEQNNEIRVLKGAEQEEIERILTVISNEIGTFATEIATGYRMAVELDFIFAKASLAYDMKATMPTLSAGKTIVLKQARHPLIAPKQVVPTDITLGETFDTLLITGPNTGGKTVVLKTIGLLSAMAMCGLMLPVAEGSVVSVFPEILVDIGDEQSIEQSLSTFSAHMKNIITILQQVNPHSLVLLDELGAGTDPVEGAALAIAILEELRKQGATIAVTTHYAELKEFALRTDGVENGCCEFDVATLRPTYRLLIGVPGRSNAFAISQRLGISTSIVERAKSLVSAENAEFEEVVQSLETQRQALEQEKQQAEVLRQQVEKLYQQAEAQKKQQESHAMAVQEQAQRQASALVARTRAQLEEVIAQLDEAKKQATLSPGQRANLRGKLNQLEKEADPVAKPARQGKLSRPLQVGDGVLLLDINRPATVTEVSADGQQVTVQSGALKMRVPLSNLQLTDQKPKPTVGKRTRTVTTSTASARGGGLSELDVRGQTAEEALLEVDRFLDSATLNHLNQVTIIHGKGTGVLRKAIQNHLKRHPAVKSYRLGVFGEGESGVTVVELK